jgi:ABC-type bacteriocin/lantibiotic exporter with double-glycine peptidase domain
MFCTVKCITLVASPKIQQQNYVILEHGAHKNETLLQIMSNSTTITTAAAPD